MQWVTRDHVHFDRVAAAWVIKRFVDRDAEFVYVPRGKEDLRPPQAKPFGLPGTELTDHDAGGTTFHKILVRYDLVKDPALSSIDQLMTNGVLNTLNKTPYPADRLGELTAGVQGLVEGFALISGSDDEQLDKTFPLFDALYALLQMEDLMRSRGEEKPAANLGSTVWRSIFANAASTFLRARGKVWSTESIKDLDGEFETQLDGIRTFAAARAR